MTYLSKTLPFVLLFALATPVLAQTTETAGTNDAAPATETEASPDPLALSLGSQDSGDRKPGDVYIDSEHGDWELRCVFTDSGNDPCQLYQLLTDPNGNPVAEINIFALGGEGQPAAGGTVITPLETLLTQQLSVSVDGGAVKKYPFSWCSQIGCFSRIGFTEDDIAGFKRGISATLSIVPVTAPDQKVNLNVSLKGFTAGFTATQERTAPKQ